MSSTCRPGCAACCIAPSISSPLPGLPDGKPAGVPCPHLDDQLRCRLFGLPQRPQVCRSLAPEPDMCGKDREHAIRFLSDLETATQPLTPHLFVTSELDLRQHSGAAEAHNGASLRGAARSTS